MSGPPTFMAMMCLSFAFACAGPPGKDAQPSDAGPGVVDYGVLTPAELEVAKMTAELTGVTIPADGRPVMTLKVTERHGSGVRGLSATAVNWRFALIKLAQGVNASANDSWVSYMAANDHSTASTETATALTDNGDGTYTFVARRKEVLRRRGENLSPLEVEEVVAAVAGGQPSCRIQQRP